MNLDFKIIRDKAKEHAEKIGSFAAKKNRWFLALIFFIFIGYSGYLWYKYIYNPQWNDARQQEYRNTKSADSNFNVDKMKKIVTEVDGRQAEYNKNVDNLQDIFRLK